MDSGSCKVTIVIREYEIFSCMRPQEVNEFFAEISLRTARRWT